MTAYDPQAIDTPSKLRQRAIDRSKPTTRSNRLLAAIGVAIVLVAGIAVGTQWQRATTQTPTYPSCQTLAPSNHHALCTVTLHGKTALLAANGDYYTLNGEPTK